MKSISSSILLIFLFVQGYAQREINVKECFAFNAKYNNSIQDDKLLMRYIKSVFPYEYENSKSNEFQLNKLKQTALADLQNQVDKVSYETTYFIDLTPSVPEYNFEYKGFQLRLFPDDLRYHCDYKGYTTGEGGLGTIILSPCLTFYNAHKISVFFNMPEAIAETSINKRNTQESNKRGKFRFRIFYSIIPPSIGNDLKLTFFTGTRRLNTEEVNCVVSKVEVYDSYTDYKTTTNIENGYSNSNEQSTNSSENNTSKNESNSNNITSEKVISKNSTPNILTEYENRMLNLMRSNKGTDSKCKQITSIDDFVGKYYNAICKKAFIQIDANTSPSRMSVKRKPCVGLFGATAYVYKLQDNYLVTQSCSTDHTTGITKCNTTILYLDANSDLIVYDYLTQTSKNPDLTIYRFEKGE